MKLATKIIERNILIGIKLEIVSVFRFVSGAHYKSTVNFTWQIFFLYCDPILYFHPSPTTLCPTACVMCVMVCGETHYLVLLHTKQHVTQISSFCSNIYAACHSLQRGKQMTNIPGGFIQFEYHKRDGLGWYRASVIDLSCLRSSLVHSIILED